MEFKSGKVATCAVLSSAVDAGTGALRWSLDTDGMQEEHLSAVATDRGNDAGNDASSSAPVASV